ncbi:MAG: PaaI family thioesterase [Candidatus Thermoplasmatota archaeon]|nr:PaaI family thioesterase [Candidatus Thermoplasmatota archaeon]
MHADGSFDRLVGYNLISAENGESTVELEVKEALRQRFGLLHGGAIATLADYCMGTAFYSMGECTAVTAQMDINYISSVKEGKVTGYGRVKKPGNKLSFCECEIKSSSGELVATATGVYYRIS